MAGGKGERFWPLSRISMPKQCLKIVTKKSIIEDTVDRLKPLIPSSRIFVSTNYDLHKHIKKVLPNVNYVLEPVGKDTAACIGLSCMEIMRKYGDCVIFVETSDHIYKDNGKYLDHIKSAYEMAKKDNIVLIGIKPTFPNTGFGYIKQGKQLKDGKFKFYEVGEFKEKPDLKKAKQFVSSGDYLWNSGMFVFKPSVMLEEIKKYMPKLYSGLMVIKNSRFDQSVKKNVFDSLDKVSVDFGIMEKSDKTVLLRGDFSWDDVGDWKLLESVHDKDKDGNVVFGNSFALNSKGNIVYNSKDGKIIALCNVNDLIVVDTDDALLVCPKKDAQKVKDLVHEIKKNNLNKYL
jgi:mannose-1-phosphate guanylyltransferase